MAVKSVYIAQPEIEGELIRIRDDEHHHLSVGRAAVGEHIEIFNGKGQVWEASIAAVVRRETQARILGSRLAPPDQNELILGLSLIRSAAFEVALEKTVETGVTRIIPVIASRSNVKEWKMGRWQKTIVEAAKQSKRYHLPLLDEPMEFAKILDVQAATRIMFAERDGSALKPALIGSPVLYLIGPEGGWTDEELNSGRQHGFTLVDLGSTILRSETAAIAATSLLRYELQNRG